MSMSGVRRSVWSGGDDPGVAVDQATADELLRLAHLFVLSGVTLLLVVTRAVTMSGGLPEIPSTLALVWGGALLTGWAVTLVYGIYVTLTARSWGWFVLCLFPFTCVPASLAYAWIRRREIERAVLGAQRRRPARRPPPGGAPR